MIGKLITKEKRTLFLAAFESARPPGFCLVFTFRLLRIAAAAATGPGSPFCSRADVDVAYT